MVLLYCYVVATPVQDFYFSPNQRIWCCWHICAAGQLCKNIFWSKMTQSSQKDTSTNFLVGGLEHFLFSHILGIIIPIDELIFFRGVALAHQPVIGEAWSFCWFQWIIPWPEECKVSLLQGTVAPFTRCTSSTSSVFFYVGRSWLLKLCAVGLLKNPPWCWGFAICMGFLRTEHPRIPGFCREIWNDIIRY